MEYMPAIVALAFVAFALVSRRLQPTVLTGPMLFTALGLLLGPQMLGWASLGGNSELPTLLLEGTLVVVLFTDASVINSSRWREEAGLPGRLLGIGLPATILLGWGLAAVWFPDLSIWEAAVLAAMLSATDAALGKAVVSNPRVPERIRQALNVEGGLNDGVALPVFVVFLETAQAVSDSLSFGDLLGEIVPEVVIAVAVGAVVGFGGAAAINWARRKEWALEYWLQVAVIALAFAAYLIAQPLYGSGFIAAWIAGVTYGRFHRTRSGDGNELAEATGDVLTMLSLLLFGIALGPVLADVTAAAVGYGLASLAVVRLLAVRIALAGSGLSTPSVLYLGWFGPRGLATLILTITVIGSDELAGASIITEVALVTVALSVVLHGVTSWWGSNAYADWLDGHEDRAAMPETESVASVPIPRRSRPGAR